MQTRNFMRMDRASIMTKWVHPTKYKYILYVNSGKYKIFKNHNKILRSPTVFKTKRKNIDKYITFYFLLYLLWIVQVSRKLLSSQWKPPSFLVETVILKKGLWEKGLWEKGLTLEIKLGPLFQGLVYPKYSEL